MACLLVARSASADEDSDSDQADKEPPTNAACLACHADADEMDEEYLVDPALFEREPHTEDNDVSCVGCHTKAAEVADIEDHGELGPASCSGECHEVADDLAEGAHGWQSRKDRKQPTCQTCHGHGHRVRPVDDKDSPVYHSNQVKLCSQCHEGESMRRYAQSVHANPSKEKKGKTPVCSSCHGAHDILSADLQHNVRFKRKLTRRCARCHEDEWKVYRTSIHGTALFDLHKAGAAACADCHGGHDIRPPEAYDSRVHAHHVSATCAECHGNARLIRRFGIKSDVVATYAESYHGRASKLDEKVQVANCASCHQHHAIYPAKDPRSSVHPDNLRKACGECHPGASDRFIQGKIHVASIGNHWGGLVRSLYLWLIAFACLGMAAHNFLDFRRKFQIRNKDRRKKASVVRMSLEARVSHAFFLTAFIALAYTGFAIMFPQSWWVAPIHVVSKAESFRGTLHRVAAVIMIFVTLWHSGVMLFTRRGRRELGDLLPRLCDLRDLRDNFLFFIGKRDERPAFDRFGYVEKFEYWALVWGTWVMILTGVVLWFEDISLVFIPLWLWDVIRVVHRYEAILAVSSIILWHFYHVMVNPDEAPLSMVWIDGRIPIEEVKERYPRHYQRLIRDGVITSNGQSHGASEDDDSIIL